MSNSFLFSRRTFLKQGSLAVGLPAVALAAESTTATPILNQQEGMAYRKVPRTDISVSVLSLGGLVMGEGVRRYAIDKGVNFFHVANNYLNGESIKELGKVMKDHRDKVYLAVKDTFDYGDGKDDIGSILKLLNTDHIDFIMFNRHDPEDVLDDRIQTYFEKWKKEGKVRWAGLTIHNKIKETTAAGIKTQFYNLVMPVLDQPNLEAMAEELREAEKLEVGFMAMKTMKGMKDREMEVAFLKKVLANPAVTTVNKGIGSYDMFDTYAEACKTLLSQVEDKQLYRYAQANRANNCMMCAECTQVCPNGIDIPTMLRCADYYYDQCGWTEHAKVSYAEVPAGCRADSCEECGTCETVCPNGLAIRSHLARAREIFC
jgi:predicted aldo/keto reductase-like oxidoreductase